jgi:hypothetical protein
MTLDARMAVEALRAGVPNGAAVRLMGTEQTAIEHGFEAALAAAWSDSGPARTGIGMAGGFGTGKSHLLGYLAEVARQQGFVVSRVVVSKEMPLSHPAHVLAAALRDATLPDRPDDPIAACVAILREKTDAMQAIETAVAAQGDALAPLFAACLFLLRRGATPAETVRRIARLWSGAKVSIPAIRRELTAAGVGRTYPLKALPVAAMTQQLIRFVPLLFRAAGYGGWCILLDEVELIGRYTPLQRALSYAVLAGLLGLHAAGRTPGIVTAYAITDDFVTAVINARQDREKLPERLMLKGRSAEAGMVPQAVRHIEWTVLQSRIAPPTRADLTQCHDRLRDLYRSAYDWSPPPLPPPEPSATRTLRQYIKGWITQWDLLRLGGGAVRLIEGSIATDYREDAALGAAHDDPDSEEDSDQ